MRYRIEEFGSQVPPQHAGDDSMLFAVVIGFFIGIALTYLAVRGKQRWLLFWGGGLVLVSIVYFVAFAMGYT
ncbi:MAG: hypothetical protein OEZ33_06420 [Gammaproteobacteria bacterium]|nr:hypothetical protein [Gammaproteobacteria bacterium]MDH5777824.1 hypothetical protein [Gammaproteobacteria bacterium]